jgi:hypothetical protein
MTSRYFAKKEEVDIATDLASSVKDVWVVIEGVFWQDEFGAGWYDCQGKQQFDDVSRVPLCSSSILKLAETQIKGARKFLEICSHTFNVIMGTCDDKKVACYIIHVFSWDKSRISVALATIFGWIDPKDIPHSFEKRVRTWLRIVLGK